MPHKITVEPTVELLTTSEAKTWLRVDHANDDTLIDTLVKAARKEAELYTGKAFITQTCAYYLDRIPQSRGEAWWNGQRVGSITDFMGELDYIELPISPVQSISSFKYYTLDNTEYTYSSDNYSLDDISAPARIFLNSGATWPCSLRNRNSIKITFVTGYGDASTDVDSLIIRAVAMIVADRYENRGDDKALRVRSMPGEAMSILNKFRIINF